MELRRRPAQAVADAATAKTGKVTALSPAVAVGASASPAPAASPPPALESELPASRNFTRDVHVFVRIADQLNGNGSTKAVKALGALGDSLFERGALRTEADLAAKLVAGPSDDAKAAAEVTTKWCYGLQEADTLKTLCRALGQLAATGWTASRNALRAWSKHHQRGQAEPPGCLAMPSLRTLRAQILDRIGQVSCRGCHMLCNS